MRKYFFLTCLLMVGSLFAKKAPPQEFTGLGEGPSIHSPWLTGPLLAPSSITVPPGHLNIEPYIYATAQTGNYNNEWKVVEHNTFWNNVFQPPIQFGLLSWMDFQILPTVVYNHTEGASQWGFTDLPLIIGIQLYKSSGHKAKWITGLKLSLKEVIPIGKYQNLNPHKLGTDAIGQGSWQSTCALTWGNLFYLGGYHYLSLRTALEYTFPAPVHVKNLNYYGGGAGTRGKVYPAQFFVVDVGMEYALTRHWVLALDIVGQWQGSTRFEGSTSVRNSVPAGCQYSLAPAIEYNWSANLGLIVGPWFTIGGRNMGQFASAVLAFNYYH